MCRVIMLLVKNEFVKYLEGVLLHFPESPMVDSGCHELVFIIGRKAHFSQLSIVKVDAGLYFERDPVKDYHLGVSNGLLENQCHLLGVRAE